MAKRRVLRRVGQGSAVIAVVLAVLVYATTSGCATFGAGAEGARLERVKADPKFKDGHFENIEPTEMMPGEDRWSVMAEFAFGNDEMRVPTCALPLFPDGAKKFATPPESGLRITWLGHSSTIIELDGKVILTDPMWSNRASPSSIAGPKRFHPPPIPLDALPKVDAVIVSHDHYDHLDMTTVQALAAKGAVIHVALGVGAHLDRWKIPAAQIVEHAWWEEGDVGNGVKVVSTPSRHFSGRGLFDRNKKLWTSWAVIGPSHRVYFTGDTGMTAAFDEIREKLGPFDVGMYEIGQYHPSWGQIHLGPAGALKAHQMIGAKKMIPIHWATFELGLHAWSEPPETLTGLAREASVSLLTPMLGEPIEPATASETARWWRDLPPTTKSCPDGSKVAVKGLDDWPI